jgi:2-polyprenyl-3-methyl-5-hydroxy-6-metoxy-1,4-benzoquinol methylase
MSNFRKVKYVFLRYCILILKKTEILSSLACRLVQITGKHKDPIHPKHLIQIRKPWYINHIKKKDIVLDIGCNNGQHTIRIAKHCHKIYGIDKDKRGIVLAESEIARNKLKNIIILNHDIEKTLPFKAKMFDKVILLDVLEHIHKRKQLLKEIKRILMKNGLLLLSVPNSQTSWKKLLRKYNLFSYSDPDHKVEFSKQQIINLLKSVRLKVLDIYPVVFDTPLVGFIDIIGGISLSWYRNLVRWRRNKIINHPVESIGMEIICQKP